MSIINRFPTGGGADSEELTATKSQVLSPYTAVTHDSDGEPVQGTMKDNGAVSYSLPINGSYAIPQGYHNGQGKVTQSITTMNGSTVNPSTSTVTIGTDKKYINGNFTIPAFSLPSASVIKKGTKVTIYGKTVTGTFEGWVPVAGDWYYNGVFQYGFSIETSGVTSQNTRILITTKSSIVIKNTDSVDVRSYSTVTINGAFIFNYSGAVSATVRIKGVDYNSNESGGNNFYTFTVNISQAISGPILVILKNVKPNESYVTRVRVS